MGKKGLKKNRISAKEFFKHHKYTSINLISSKNFKDSLKDNLADYYLKINKLEKDMKINKTFLKKYWKIIVPITATFIVGVGALLFFVSRDNEVQDSQDTQVLIKAEVVYTEGRVEFKKIDGDWQEVDGGLVLEENMVVRSDDDSKAIINVDDGSAIRLNENTEVTLTSMDPEHMVFTNNKGELYSRVIESERKFEVVVADYTFRSLGTAYKTINTNDTQGVEVYHSQVSCLEKDDLYIDEGEEFYTKNTEEPEKEGEVTDINISELKKDEFVKWNKEQDQALDEFKDHLGLLTCYDETDQENEHSSDDSTEVNDDDLVIGLTGTSVGDGVNLSWTVSGVDTTNGFKIVKGPYANPVYPGNSYLYISNGAQREYTWPITDGKTYHFRVCQYLANDTCGTYSQDVVVTAPYIASSSGVNSISVSDNGNKTVSWSVDGNSTSGFKVVWSKDAGATYPPRCSDDQYQYFSSPSQATSNVLDPFSGNGTYYVRVCEYLGGSCGVYSNEIAVVL